jgi:hypothetical protein
LPPDQVGAFAARFGIAEPQHPAVWQAATLEATLRRHGLLWFGGHSGNFNHVVVLNAISGNTVYYGDPATGEEATCTLAAFNSWTRQRMGLPNPLYYIGSQAAG